ncbi:hypothetical protein BJV78DRAFT_1238675 [Lactifluus subvellereus]|nr:hypothetical protein BJV78DRAFT_1238675 [Lactifluus subvellereus]
MLPVHNRWRFPGAFRSQNNFKTFVWTIADSDDLFPRHLADTKHFLLYISSPHRGRWSPLEKITHMTLVIMNPWNREEIFQA